MTRKKNIPQVRKQHLEEIMRCGSDPVYFIEKYVKISHPKKGVLPFKLYPYQQDCLSTFLEHRHVITNKSRQLGLSTLAAGYSLWMTLFQREKNVLVIATKLSTAQLFIRKVKGMFKYLPTWLVVPSVTSETNKSIEFDNGSKIHAIPTSPDAGRGEAVSLLIVDEAAWIEDFENLWIGLLPTLSMGGDVVLISSPSGVGTRFHKIWIGAQAGTNDFHPVELPWQVHPEHDQEWFEQQCQNIGSQRGINSELLCLFEGSGNGFVDQQEISWLEMNNKLPIAKYGPDNQVWIWKYQEAGHKYLLAADVARGDGEDYSAFHVIDTTADEVVCEYKGQLPADEFGKLIDDVGRRYSNAIAVVEQQGGGIATALELKRLKYPRLFYEKFSKEVLLGTRTLLDHEVAEITPGLMMNSKNRPEGLMKLEQALRRRSLRIHSSRFLDELKTFVWNKSKAQAMKGYNDDLVMSLCIGLLYYDPLGGVNQITGTDNDALAMIQAMSVSTKTTSNLEGTGQADGWGSNQQDPAGYFGSPGGRKMNSTRQVVYGRGVVRNPWGWMDD